MLSKTIILLTISMLFTQDYPAIGSSESLDIMTWNVQNYPKHNQTNSYMVDIINQINVDMTFTNSMGIIVRKFKF